MNALTQPAALAASPLNINLTDFIDEFGDELLESLNRSNPPVYTGSDNAHRQLVMDRLKRKPFAAQAEVVQAITALLLDRNEQAGIINAEMGTGKTMMAIAVAAVMHAAGYRRTLVISPPHLVYKWRREILETIPAARVWVLNGPDTLLKLLKLRDQMGDAYDGRRSSSSSAACGCGWASTGGSPAGRNAPPAASCSLRARIAGRSSRTWKATWSRWRSSSVVTVDVPVPPVVGRSGR